MSSYIQSLLTQIQEHIERLTSRIVSVENRITELKEEIDELYDAINEDNHSQQQNDDSDVEYLPVINDDDEYDYYDDNQ